MSHESRALIKSFGSVRIFLTLLQKTLIPSLHFCGAINSYDLYNGISGRV